MYELQNKKVVEQFDVFYDTEADGTHQTLVLDDGNVIWIFTPGIHFETTLIGNTIKEVVPYYGVDIGRFPGRCFNLFFEKGCYHHWAFQ